MSISGSNSVLNQFAPAFAINKPLDGDGLIYNHAKKRYENSSLAKLLGAKTLNELQDVQLDIPNLLLGDTLVYSTVIDTLTGLPVQRWTNADVSLGASVRFTSLVDTNATPSPNQYLKWNNFTTLDVDSQLDYVSSIPASDISGLSALLLTKTDKIIPALIGNFAALDASGNLIDSTFNVNSFATVAQGALADSALQPGIVNNVSELINDAGYLTQINFESIGDLIDVDITDVAINDTLVFDGNRFIVMPYSSPETITASNLGLGEGVFAQKTISDLQFKSIVAGSNIAINSDANTITINSTASGSGVLVVPDISSIPLVGSYVGYQVFVVDSNDNGNKVGEWSMRLWTGSSWIITSSQDAATLDAKTIVAFITVGSLATTIVGTLSDGSRVSQIVVEITTAFNGLTPPQFLSIGDAGDPESLMAFDEIDLGTVGSYMSSTSFVYDTGTDVDIIASFDAGSATVGNAKIIITYN